MQIETDTSSSRTNWSLIQDAASSNTARNLLAREKMAKRYWPAIYAFVRRSGKSVEDSADLTQAFICDVMIGRKLLKKADPALGRFRSLMLTSLRNYLYERHRHDAAQSRQPDGKMVMSIDAAAGEAIDMEPGASPEQAFDREWARALVVAAIDRTRRECTEAGLMQHWRVFEARVLQPLVNGRQATAYSTLVETLGLESAAQGSNMMVVVKRRFVRALAAEIAGTVNSREDVEDELRALWKTLGVPA